MTGLHDTFSARDANSREFHREQLSAMMDGALSADEARFLLRRMEHDDELAACWERWQFAGAAMRGYAGCALPADFSRRVGRAIADDLACDDAMQHQSQATAGSSTAPGARRPLLRWGGGAALAASVAIAALLGARALSIPADAPPLALAGAAAPAVVPAATPEGDTPTPRSVAPDIVQAATVVVAAASVSQGNRTRPHVLASAQALPAGRSVPVASKPSASAAVRQSSTSGTAVANARPVQGLNTMSDAGMVPKPWPRALVPGASAAGEVTAGLDGSPGFQPFQSLPQSPRREWSPPASSAEAAAPSP